MDSEICKEKASAQSKTATKSFRRRYSVKRMMAKPKLRERWYVLYPLIEIFIRLTYLEHIQNSFIVGDFPT